MIALLGDVYGERRKRLEGMVVRPASGSCWSDVGQHSRRWITSLDEADFGVVPPSSEEGLSVAHWLFITVAHGALHIGRIQLLRSLIEGGEERAC